MHGCDFWDESEQTFDHSRGLQDLSIDSFALSQPFINEGYQPKVVDGLLSGTLDVSESHYQLLRAFLPEIALRRVSQHLEMEHYLTHEFGDLCLMIAAKRK